MITFFTGLYTTLVTHWVTIQLAWTTGKSIIKITKFFNSMKGIATKEQVKMIATILDDLKKFKNPILETFDGPAYEFSINLIDDYGIEKLPTEVKEPLSAVLQMVVDKSYDAVPQEAGKILASLIDIKKVSEEREIKFAVAGCEFILEGILLWIESRKSEEE